MSKRVRVQEVTPEQFSTLHRVLANPFYGSEQAVIEACKAAGIAPPTEFEEVKLVVVYK